jgi:hypothetical protein
MWEGSKFGGRVTDVTDRKKVFIAVSLRLIKPIAADVPKVPSKLCAGAE